MLSSTSKASGHPIATSLGTHESTGAVDIAYINVNAGKIEMDVQLKYS